MQTENNNVPAADDMNTIEGGVTVVKELDHAQVILNPTQYAIELFKPFNDKLATEKRRARRIKYDIQTPDGMVVAKELAATFVKIRTTAEKAKTEAKRPIDKAGKLILEQYNVLEAAAKAEEKVHADAIEAERQRLADIEEAKRKAELARIEAIEGRLAHIRSIPTRMAKADSLTLTTSLEELLAKQLDPALYDEFLSQAAEAMLEVTDQLRELHAEALTREAEARRIEAERAELERLRAEQAATEKRLKDEAEERERTAQAEREKAAAEKADLERQLAEMRAQFAAMQPAPAVEAAPAPQADPIEQLAETIEVEEPAQAPLSQIRGGGMRTMVDRADPVEVAVNVSPDRPSDMLILSTLSIRFHVSQETALEWIERFDVSAARNVLKAA